MGQEQPPQPPPPPGPPPPGWQQQPAYVQVRPGNGFAVAALVLGIVGAVFGLIPLTALIALICGLLAIIFGAVGIGRARRVGSGMGMAVAGLVLGILALVLSIVGFVIVDEALRELPITPR